MNKNLIGTTALVFLLSFAFVMMHADIFRPGVYAENSLNPKVYYLVFNPRLHNHDNQTIIKYKGWNDPYTLANQYINIVRDISHNNLNYTIVKQQEVDGIFVKKNGFQYTGDSMIDCLEKGIGCNGLESEDFIDYPLLLTQYSICEMVNKGEIDELWLNGGPRFGYYEANMAGTGGFSTNGPVISDTSCQRTIHIMGFNYERGIKEMVHDLGHRAEGTFDHYIGTQLNSSGFGWTEFRSHYTGDSATPVGCGNIHFPSNSNEAYSYAKTTATSSNCEDWLHYPNMTGATTSVSCNNWNCDELGYYTWWFKHLPHVSGTDSNGKFNNWWFYISNAQANDTNPTNTPPIIPSPADSVNPSSTPVISQNPTSVVSPSTTPPLTPTVVPSPTPTTTPYPTTGEPKLPRIFPTFMPKPPFCPIIRQQINRYYYHYSR